MKPAEDPIILAMRDVARQITALREEHDQGIEEQNEHTAELAMHIEGLERKLRAAQPGQQRYTALVERVRDHGRGIITFEELMQEVGRG